MVKYFVFPVERGSLVGSKSSYGAQPGIFIAYCFDSPESASFRANIEAAIRKTAALAEIDITDGHVPVGASWPTVVRQRIERGKLVVADLTVLSPEVLFECGFAWGLGRPILPVTKTSAHRANVPEWLTDIQFGYFSSESGLKAIVDSIYLHISARRRKARSVSDAAHPRRVVLLGGAESTNEIHDKVSAACAKWGLDFYPQIRNIADLQSIDSDVAQDSAHASLLIGELHGGRSDSFVHFASGAVLAVPTAGASSKRLHKRVLLIVDPQDLNSGLAPVSARKVRNVHVINRDQLNQHLQEYGKQFREWEKKQDS